MEEYKKEVTENSKNKKTNKISLKMLAVIVLIVWIIICICIGILCVKSSTDRATDSSTDRTTYSSNETSHIINGVIIEPGPFYKPIIYLYPEKETEVTVELGNPELITCSYPTYKQGWNVIAQPDGTLIDTETGRKLYSLYWEGKETASYDLTKGFCVRREDTAKFLEEKLELLGLNYKEIEEFIIYWLPKLEENEYNYIRFATMEEINEYMPLKFSVEPDTLIRVLMQYKALDEYIELEEQMLETPERTGFVAVEWGGSELK